MNATEEPNNTPSSPAPALPPEAAAPPVPAPPAENPATPEAAEAPATPEPTASPPPAAVPPAAPMAQDSPTPTAVPAAPVSTDTSSGTPELSAEVEAEIAAAMSDMDAAAGTNAPNAAPPTRAIRGPRVVQGGREHRKGIVVSIGPDDVFIEFGPKELGVASRKPFEEVNELPIVGSTLEVVIERFDSSEGLFICARPGAVQKADWEMLEPGQIVEARVTGVNKGGLEMEVAKHRAFMPASHVDTSRIEDLSVFIGEKMPCKVIKIDRMGRGNITLSRREVMKEEQKETASKLQETLSVGDTVTGKVRKIMPFGAFVDMGGLDGLGKRTYTVTFDFQTGVEGDPMTAYDNRTGTLWVGAIAFGATHVRVGTAIFGARASG